jgi:uncharacterized membrane protein
MVGVFGYWQWLDTGPLFGVPLLNFAGWFITSLLAGILMEPRRVAVTKAGWVLGPFALFLAVVCWLAMDSAASQMLFGLGLGVCVLQARLGSAPVPVAEVAR